MNNGATWKDASFDALFETDQTTVGHVNNLGAGIWFVGAQHAQLSDVPETLTPPQRRIEPPGIRRMEPFPPGPDEKQDPAMLELLNGPLRERPTNLNVRDTRALSEVLAAVPDFTRGFDPGESALDYLDRVTNARERLSEAISCLTPERVDSILAVAGS